MDDFEEDVTRLSMWLDDISGEIEKDPSLADHKALQFLSLSITKFLQTRRDALISLIGGAKH